MTNDKWSDLLNVASQAATPAEPLLGEISAPHSHNRRGDLVARTGFDFDEGQRERPRRFVVGDDVDLARDLAAVFALADRGDEISGDYPVALPLEILRDQALAVFPQSQM